MRLTFLFRHQTFLLSKLKITTIGFKSILTPPHFEPIKTLTIVNLGSNLRIYNRFKRRIIQTYFPTLLTDWPLLLSTTILVNNTLFEPLIKLFAISFKNILTSPHFEPIKTLASIYLFQQILISHCRPNRVVIAGLPTRSIATGQVENYSQNQQYLLFHLINRLLQPVLFYTSFPQNKSDLFLLPIKYTIANNDNNNSYMIDLIIINYSYGQEKRDRTKS